MTQIRLARITPILIGILGVACVWLVVLLGCAPAGSGPPSVPVTSDPQAKSENASPTATTPPAVPASGSTGDTDDSDHADDPVLDCNVLPEGDFLTIWESQADLQRVLGCPTSHHPRIEPTAWEIKTAYQPFEHGVMIWSDHVGWYPQPVVFVLYPDGSFQRFDDTFDPTVDSGQSVDPAPAGFVSPVLGFGKVWVENLEVQATLGWATAEEKAGTGRFTLFTGGEMVWLDQTQQIYVFANGQVYEFERYNANR